MLYNVLGMLSFDLVRMIFDYSFEYRWQRSFGCFVDSKDVHYPRDSEVHDYSEMIVFDNDSVDTCVRASAAGRVTHFIQQDGRVCCNMYGGDCSPSFHDVRRHMDYKFVPFSSHGFPSILPKSDQYKFVLEKNRDTDVRGDIIVEQFRVREYSYRDKEDMSRALPSNSDMRAAAVTDRDISFAGPNGVRIYNMDTKRWRNVITTDRLDVYDFFAMGTGSSLSDPLRPLMIVEQKSGRCLREIERSSGNALQPRLFAFDYKMACNDRGMTFLCQSSDDRWRECCVSMLDSHGDYVSTLTTDQNNDDNSNFTPWSARAVCVGNRLIYVYELCHCKAGVKRRVSVFGL
jgi:hypothetical protein